MAIEHYCIGAFFAAVVGMVLVTAWLLGQARQKKVIRAKLFRD